MYINFVDGLNDMREVDKESAFDLPFFLTAPSIKAVCVANKIGHVRYSPRNLTGYVRLSDIAFNESALFEVGGGLVAFIGVPLKIEANPFHIYIPHNPFHGYRDEYLKIKIDNGIFGYFNVFENKVYYLRLV